MRKLFFTLVVLLSILSMGATVNLKITTYNIRHGLGVDNVFNFQRVKETIQKINPDILILNEVDQGNARSGDVYQAKEIAALMGMEYYFYATEGKTNYGIAVLSKYPVIKAEGFNLPQPRFMKAVQRGCINMIVNVCGKELSIYGAHFGLGGFQEVQKELEEIYKRYQNNPITSVIGGDFNLEWAPLRSAVPQMFKSDFKSSNHSIGKDLYTIPADSPGPQIDFLLVTNDVIVKDTYTYDSRASDHLPVIAEIELEL